MPFSPYQTAAEGCLCRTFLREAANLLCFHPLLKCSSHIWEELSFWPWFALPPPSALHQPFEKPWAKNNQKKKQQTIKRLFLCHCWYFICKMKKIVSSYQCKISEDQQGDQQHCRHYWIAITGYWVQSKTSLGEKPRIIVTTRSTHLHVNIETQHGLGWKRP